VAAIDDTKCIGKTSCPAHVRPTASRGGWREQGHASQTIDHGYRRTKGADFRPSVCRNHSCVLLGVGRSSGLLVPVGLTALLDLFVLLLLAVVQDRLYLAIAFLADAVHLCLPIVGSERGVGT